MRAVFWLLREGYSDISTRLLVTMTSARAHTHAGAGTHRSPRVPSAIHKALSVVVGRNLDNLNLDMCMELLEQTPRGQRAAQLGPGGRQDGSRPLRHEHRARQRLGRLCRGARSNSAPPRSRSLSTYTPRSRPPVGSPKTDFPELRSAPLVECRRPQLCFVPLQSIEAHLSTISAPPSRRPERCPCRAR